MSTTPWWRLAARMTVAGGAIVFACLAYTWITLPDVRPLRMRNPSTTAFMELRAEQDARDGKHPKVVWRWVPYRDISPLLVRSVIVTEDARFWDHDGIDLAELRAALEASWASGTEPRGASTITQQLAKNLYLSPSRNPFRKEIEFMIARRLEAELSKTRILELYLNVIEWGDQVWGADAAAKTYFGRAAADLSLEQAALLAGALINPRVYSPAKPNARLLRRQQMILGRMGGAASSESSR